MGSIRERKNKTGEIRYRAEIRINRTGYPAFTESKTFSNRKVAENWIKKRELEIDENPNILLGVSVTKDMTLSQAIDRYLDEVGDNYGRTKRTTLNLIKKFPIAKIPLLKIHPSHVIDHVQLRRNGIDYLGLKGIATSTMTHELLHIRSVLSYASIMWDINVNLNDFDKVSSKLRTTRQITPSQKRDRLLTNDELIRLTKYFYEKWQGVKHYPMHLVMWFAIYSCRRQAEICRLLISDYHGDKCLVRDVKNPNGSKGNHKTFSVNENCKKIIELVLSDKYRTKMLKLEHSPDFIFPLNGKSLSKEFTEACYMLGIEDLHFHDLRHEGCTRLAEQGLTVPQIQHFSLHDSWSSLQRYVSVQKREECLDFEDVVRILELDDDIGII